ncbi:aromatic amino acid aminotransferase-like protein [Thermochaetoides thermophila DSM 1495]|uniref:Aromatic amino acid aminotransferase-like protein n=1 Tax=Chaetomium thermophilum (strain DSM 1495 / CBS 144.50 / IMI 039719) TaxID=759272 RepID=G0SE20_CHATD|nr:aromatic amino acid aminotransferase-like protein [Thermochaetoides thermophila DSM 1495]EGS18197.1 aromatic amino acid aminotransferase-like protein [Thermochaetoides thermophila DSM 1495]
MTSHTDSDLPPPVDLSHHFSSITKRRAPSEIKDAYKFFSIPGILNIAGGLPNPSYFPFDTLEAQAAKPTRFTPPSSSNSSPVHITLPTSAPPKDGDPTKRIDVSTALQYGTPEGYPPLLGWIRDFTRKHLHPSAPYQGGPDVILTCGSTDGFAKVLSLLIDPWTEGKDDYRDRPGLLVEEFTYGNVLAQARPLGVNIVPVKADQQGLVAYGEGGLESVLGGWDASKGRRPNVLYTVSLGGNPTGTVVGMERRKEVYEVCRRWDVVVVEDEPYWFLQFPNAQKEQARGRGLAVPKGAEENVSKKPSSGDWFLESLTPSYMSIDTDGRVIRLDTFSKTVAPGCRLGWVTAQPAIIERLQRITEATTQQPSGFVQGLVAELLIGQQGNKQQSSKPGWFWASSRRNASDEKAWDFSGFIHWLSGLREAYESRMLRMCRALDRDNYLLNTSPGPSPSATVQVPSPDDDFLLVTKSPLYTFTYPAGGMFIWLRLNFPTHPLYSIPPPPRTLPPDLTPHQLLSSALMIYLTRKPYRVLAAPGSMFAATEEIRREEGWKWFRLCFAAVDEDKVEEAGRRFAEGVRGFWRVRDWKIVKKLVTEGADGDSVDGEQVWNIGAFGMGC